MRRIFLPLVLMHASVAAADAPTGTVPVATDQEAQRLLDEGTRLFTEDASYEAARDAFQRSYERSPSWRALNGIALTYQEQGRYLDSLVTYERLLRDEGATLTPDQRTTVDRRIAPLVAKVGVVEVSAEQPTTAIALDGEAIGIAPLRRAVRLMPGRHVVVATLSGHRPLTRTIEVGAGQHVPLVVELEPEQVIIRTTPIRLERRVPRWVPWATMGGGGALVVVGGLLRLAARSDFDAFDASVAASATSMSVIGDRDRYDRAQLENRIATGGFIAGGLAVVGGAVLLALNQPRPVEVIPARRGISVVVHF